MATVDAARTTKIAAATNWAPALRLLLPTAKPAAAHRISTSGRSGTRTAATAPARIGESVENERIQRGMLRLRCRVNQWNAASPISATPKTSRTHDAHVGGVACKPPSSPEPVTNAAVRATKPTSQPPRKARLAGRGRGACSTSTAGMTVIGDSAMTAANAMSLLRTEAQLASTGSNHRIGVASARSAFAAQRPGGHPVRHGFALGSVGDGIGHQAPPVALLAQGPAAQAPLDDLVQLQTVGLVAPRAVRLTREQHRQVNQHRDRRANHAKRAADRLAVVPDRRERSH